MRFPHRTFGFALLGVFALCLSARAGTMVEEPISADALAVDLGFQVKQGTFKFDQPMYAKAEFVYVGNESGLGDPSGATTLVTEKPSREIPFYYIFRGQKIEPLTSEQGKSLRLSLGDRAVTYCFNDPLYGAKAARGRQSQFSLPPYKGEPIPFASFFMSSDDWINLDTPVSEAIKTMKHGYALTYYFSPEPFKKTEVVVEPSKK
jgi:hypothetical protein